MVRQPTEVQQRCWAELHRQRSVSAAARALGMSSWAVRGACQAYMTNMGLEGPLPFTKVYARKDESNLVRQLRERIAELEAQVAIRDRTIAGRDEMIHELRAAAQPWVSVHAKLDALLKRPTGIPVVTHRRIADGGVGGRRERRSA